MYGHVEALELRYERGLPWQDVRHRELEGRPVEALSQADE